MENSPETANAQIPKTPEGYVRLFRTSPMPKKYDGTFDVQTELFDTPAEAAQFAEVFQHNYYTPGTVMITKDGKFYVECKNAENRMLGTEFIENPDTCLVENVKNPLRGEKKAEDYFREKHNAARVKYGYMLACAIAFANAILATITSSSKFLVAAITFPLAILLCICANPYKKERKAKPSHSWAEIDRMDGVSFERFVASMIVRQGFGTVRDTPRTGDFGVDIIMNGRTAIQCKRSSKNLGIKPLQEVYAGMSHYGCNEAIVVTNAHFTKNAIALAKELNIKLWDRDTIAGMM